MRHIYPRLHLHSLVFGNWYFGYRLPELAADVDGDGALRVEVFHYAGGTSSKMGEAMVGVGADGLHVKEWPIPLKELTDDPSPGSPRRPEGDGGVVYSARLGSGGHFKSLGRRLETVGDILRQDRGNYHNGKGDGADGTDPLFGTREARDKMDGMRPVPVGSPEAAWRTAMLNGTPLVEVQVDGSALKVKIIER